MNEAVEQRRIALEQKDLANKARVERENFKRGQSKVSFSCPD